jgi:hypothetical protein
MSNVEIAQVIDHDEQVKHFVLDCILPTTNPKVKAKPADIYKIYKKYCNAIGQPYLTQVAFGRRFALYIYRRMVKGCKVYSCLIRKDVFVEE